MYVVPFSVTLHFQPIANLYHKQPAQTAAQPTSSTSTKPMPKPPLPTCTNLSSTAPPSTSPLSFPAASSLPRHLPLEGEQTTIRVNPRQDLEEEAVAAAATDPPDLVVVAATHIVPILTDLVRYHGRDPARAPPWQPAEELGGTGQGRALGPPTAALLARRGVGVEEEEAAEEEGETMWTTPGRAGVLAALVTTAMTAGAEAAAAAAIGTDVRCIPRAWGQDGQLTRKEPRDHCFKAEENGPSLTTRP